MPVILVASGDRKEDDNSNVRDWVGTGVEGMDSRLGSLGCTILGFHLTLHSTPDSGAQKGNESALTICCRGATKKAIWT